MDVSNIKLSEIQSLANKPIKAKPESNKAFEALVEDLSKPLEKRLWDIIQSSRRGPTEEIRPHIEETVEFITWIALGIEVVAKRFLNLNDQLDQELSIKGSKAIEVKLKRNEFSDHKEFLNFWKQHHVQFLTDIIGTLLLGHTACVVTLAQLYRALERRDDFEAKTCYFRLKMNVTTLNSLSSDPKEGEEWKKILLELGSKESFSDCNVKGRLAEFVASHLMKCDVVSLKGKNLKGIFSREDNTYQYGKFLVETSLINKNVIQHDPNLNAANILSGTLNAALENPKQGEAYFSEMLTYLDQRKKDLFVPDLQSVEQANEEDEKNLSSFFEKYQIPVEDPKSVTFLDLSGRHLKELPQLFCSTI